MKRTILIIAIACLLVLSLSISVMASEGTEDTSDGTGAVQGSAEANNTQGDGTDDISASAEDAQGASESDEAQIPISQAILDAVGGHMSEIFCVLTFLSSVINMLLYKKGLMPSIGSAVSKINSSASNVFDRVAQYSKSTDEAVEQLKSDISPILEQAQKWASESAALTESLDRMDGDTKRMQALFGMQSEIIYTMFMSAAIPQYQKDAMAECYTKIRTLTSESES